MSSKRKMELRSFVTAFLKRSGAVVEETGFELVEALLPDELSSHFKDHLLLAFDYEVAQENPQAIFVTYGSTFLDRLARLAEDYGRYTVLYAPGAGLKQPGWLEREILEKIEFVHCRPPRVARQWLEEHVFSGFYFRAVFRFYEKIEDLLPVVIDNYTGLAVPDFVEWWGNVVADEEPLKQLPRAQVLSLDELYQAACREAEKQARERAFAFQHQAKDRLAFELAKVSRYYQQLSYEIEKKMVVTEDNPKKERLAKQLAAVQADWQRREKDTLERYAVEVELHLDHLVEYRLPRLHCELEVQHKSQVLKTTVLYNPLAHRLETPVCHLCGQPAARLLPDKGNRFICTRHKEN